MQSLGEVQVGFRFILLSIKFDTSVLAAVQANVDQNLKTLYSLEDNKWKFFWEGGFVTQTFTMNVIPSSKLLKVCTVSFNRKIVDLKIITGIEYSRIS